MPWKIVSRDGKHCVYKVGEDGKPIGKPKGCHADKVKAKAQMRALYASESKASSGPESLLNTPGVEPLIMNMRSKSFNVKEVEGGRIMWVGVSSNNAIDRDNEIVSSKALQEDVARRDGKDDSVLLYGHLKNVRLGGAPFYKAVVDGMLLEAGYFDDTPLAQAVARFAIENPGAFDGAGWGISIGFKGLVDASGVYHAVDIVERSVLPLSRAANPYTAFNPTEGVMNAQKKAALDELVKALTGDAESLEIVKGMLSAADAAKALDAQGVTRKAVADVPAEPPASVIVEKTMDEDEDDDEEMMEEEKPKKPAKKKKAAAEADPITDDVLKGIAEYVNFTVKATQTEQAKEINDALQAILEHLKALDERLESVESGEAQIKAVAEAPRSVFERLKAYAASASDDTELDEDDSELIEASKGFQPKDKILADLFGK